MAKFSAGIRFAKDLFFSFIYDTSTNVMSLVKEDDDGSLEYDLDWDDVEGS